jgi:hypothetical protein
MTPWHDIRILTFFMNFLLFSNKTKIKIEENLKKKFILKLNISFVFHGLTRFITF